MSKILLPIISMTLIVVGATVARASHNINMIGDRRDSADSYDYSDYNQNYQYRPMALKRTALSLDRIILGKAVDNQEVGNTHSEEDILHGEKSQNINDDGILSDRSETMDLHRRGRANRSLYWRCYFNVVTCFKKK